MDTGTSCSISNNTSKQQKAGKMKRLNVKSCELENTKQALGNQTGKIINLVQVEREDGVVQEYNSQWEVEHAIWNNVQCHCDMS